MHSRFYLMHLLKVMYSNIGGILIAPKDFISRQTRIRSGELWLALLHSDAPCHMPYAIFYVHLPGNLDSFNGKLQTDWCKSPPCTRPGPQLAASWSLRSGERAEKALTMEQTDRQPIAILMEKSRPSDELWKQFSTQHFQMAFCTFSISEADEHDFKASAPKLCIFWPNLFAAIYEIKLMLHT